MKTIESKSKSKSYAPLQPCLWCGKEFHPLLWNLKLGGGKFCSARCGHAHRAENTCNRLDDLDFQNRFWSRCDKAGPIPAHQPELGSCWLWTGARNRDGYGHVALRGRLESTHRISWTITYGHPGDVSVLHRCDNPQCCNPSHLFLGTQFDNVHDMIQKKRHIAPKGSESGRAVITEAIALEMRTISATGIADSEIARRFAVKDSIVHRVVRGKTWAHLGGPIQSRRAPRRKLTAEQAAEIATALSSGVTATKLSSRFDVSESLIADIRHGRHWSCRTNHESQTTKG